MLTGLENEREAPEAIPDNPMPVNDLSGDEELVKQFRDAATQYYDQYRSQHTTLRDEVWKIADWMYTCGIDTSRDTGDDTHANTASTLFFTQVRTLASQIAAVWFSEDMPFSYRPSSKARGGFEDLSEGEEIAKSYNLLAKRTMELDDWQVNATDLLWKLIKYSNIPVMINWTHQKAWRRERVPIKDIDIENGQIVITGYKFDDAEDVVANRPELKVLNPDQVFADPNIPTMAGQQCILIRSLRNYAELWRDQRSGNITNVEKIDSSHEWSGTEDDEMRDERASNRGVSDLDHAWTGQFEVHDVFIRMPIDAAGKFDASKNEYRWYWVTVVGGLESGVVVRFVRNPDPDDEPPLKMIHALPDDGDNLYHFSYAQALESNYREATTAKNQMIDSKTIQIRKPMMGVRGEVYTKNPTFGQDKIIWVEDTTKSLKELQVSNNIFDCKEVLDAVEEDSKRAAGTQNPVVGEKLGSRTSASEAMNVHNQAMLPGMVMVRYVSHQFLPWYARKVYRLWQLYAMPEQVEEITHKKQVYEVKPSELYGEFAVTVDVVDEYIENQMAQAAMDYLVQTSLAIPQLAQRIDWDKFGTELFRRYKFTKNPEQFIKESTDLDAVRVAEAENAAFQNGQYNPPEEGENHEQHLSVHKQERVRYNGVEDEFPGVPLLDRHIAETEMMQATQVASRGSAPAPSGVSTPGEATGDVLESAMGAASAMPPMQ